MVKVTISPGEQSGIWHMDRSPGDIANALTAPIEDGTIAPDTGEGTSIYIGKRWRSLTPTASEILQWIEKRGVAGKLPEWRWERKTGSFILRNAEGLVRDLHDWLAERMGI